ncbi:MAG: SDR family oxidoreductase [Candidatus Coatesbacteria bacterium]
MKILFVGGTGLISTACTELAVAQGHELMHMNRGKRNATPMKGVKLLQADIRDPGEEARLALGRLEFDAVVDWIAFTPEHVRKDIELFGGRAAQYVFISSASAYQKPPKHYVITEETPLENPFWEYSRQKAACEKLLMETWAAAKFPATIVRPSLTFGNPVIPLAVSCWNRPWTIVKRIREGRPLIVPGDGTSLWPITHNTDFATGLQGLLGNPKTLGEAFHITTGEALTWNQIYERTAEACGAKLNAVHISSDFLTAFDPHLEGSLLGDKAHTTVFDNSKLKRFVPGWEAKVPYAEGVRRSVAWLSADPARQGLDPATEAAWDRIIAAHESGKALARQA